MAETLGSLIDKLSIKNLRIWHIDEKLELSKISKLEVADLRAKKELAENQRDELIKEIDCFLALAFEGKVKICDLKLKLYQNLNVRNVDDLSGFGSVISELAKRNIRLWHLEDEVRKSKNLDSQIANCKRQIDSNNQERNDLIDKVDRILESKVHQEK